MIVECPGCHSRYDVTGRPPGTEARCRCGTQFTLPAPKLEAGSLSCPQCGANVAPHSGNCQFCNAELLVKACPRCFAKIFHGAKHCSECGAGVVEAATANLEGDAMPRLCPRCEKVLVARLVGETLLDECADCHGIWLDHAALDKVLRDRSDEGVGARLARLPAQSKGPGIEALGAGGRRVYVRCPDCDQPMNRFNFGAGSGIILDRCRAHGTWFDQSELPRVVEAVGRGMSVPREMQSVAPRATVPMSTASLNALPTQNELRGASNDELRFGTFGSLLKNIGRILLDS